MGLSGNLETMTLADILQWAAHNKKTGTLLVDSDALQKKVLFRKGSIISASSNDPREALGQFLLRARLASEQQIFDGLLQQEKEHRLFGRILVDDGVLTEEQLHSALAEKMQETVYDLFLWPKGDFVFEEQQDLEAFFSVRMDPQAIVIEGVRRVDEWQRIRKVLPSEHTTFTITVRPPNPDPTMAAVLDLVEQGRSLREIALELRRSEFEAAVPLFELFEDGAIAVDDPGEYTPKSDTVASIHAQLAQAEEHLESQDFDAARQCYENVLALDRINQVAKKGLMATVAARHQHRALQKLDLEKIPVLELDLAELTRQRFDPQEGFVISRINGEWSVGSILKTCPIQEDDVLLIFARLLERGVIGLKAP